MANPIALTTTFVLKKCVDSVKENVDLLMLAVSSFNPMDLLNQATEQAFSGDILEDLMASPLGQMGQDYIATTANNAAAEVTDTLNGWVGKAMDSFENLQQLVFNTVLSTMAFDSELILYMLQKVAREAMSAIDEKQAALNKMDEKLRHLYNALVILQTDQPAYSAYLTKLRTALVLVARAQQNLKLVRSSYYARSAFQANRFNSVMSDVKSAISLLEPKKDEPELQFNTSRLLEELGKNSKEALGIPDSQILTTMLSIPSLSKEVILAADDYFTYTARVNALILAFLTGLDKLKKNQGRKVKSFVLNGMDAGIGSLDALKKEMATYLNGAPDAIENPIKGFRTTPHKVATNAITWLINLKVTYNLLTAIPVKGLVQLDDTNAAIKVYKKSCDTIKSKNNRRYGGALLRATEGQEQVGDLEQQLLVFISAANRSLIDGNVSKTLLSLGRATMSRLTVSKLQDSEIRAAFEEFANVKISDKANSLGALVFQMLDKMGLDRAADLLREGEYDDFFNSDPMTATYAGAALLGVKALMECLEYDPDFDLSLMLKGFFFAFWLKFKRSAGRSIRLQIKLNLKKLEGCSGLIEKLSNMGSLCGLVQTTGSGLKRTLGSALGLGASD